MKKELPKEVLDAKELFVKFENTDDHEKRTRLFEDAIERLNDFSVENPDSPLNEYINNLKVSYTRSLISGLKEHLNQVDIDDWFQYVHILLIKVGNEVNEIITKDPLIKETYNNFLKLHLIEFVELIKNKFGLEFK